MRTMIYIVAALVTFVGEYALRMVLPYEIASFPLTVSVLFFWFRTERARTRIVIALAAGMIFESMSGFPPGTQSAALLLTVVLSNGVEYIFSNTESRVVRALHMGFEISFYSVLLLPVASLLGALQQTEFIWSVAALPLVIAFALLWGTLLPLLAYGIPYALKRK